VSDVVAAESRASFHSGRLALLLLCPPLTRSISLDPARARELADSTYPMSSQGPS